MSDLIGKTLGPYRVLEQIGVGGMATVYKAYQPSMDRYVAVKILPHYLSTQDEQFLKRFQREARAIAKLEHAHILPVYDYGEHENIPYLTMRYIEAGTLKERIAKGALSLDEINHIIGQVGGALDYAHRLGVIHRDVKPGNVLIDNQGDTFLTDFGLARMLEASQHLTASGVGVGTPAYMSPEQSQGDKVDHRSDIYSLGVILYEMVTGRVPYEAETPMAVMLKHITDPLPLPRVVAPNVPESVELVILKALAKDPAARYQTAGEMVQALAAAIRKVENAETQRPAVTSLSEPTREDVSLITRVQKLWEQPRGKAGLIGGAVVGVILLGWLLSQIQGNITIVGPGATSTSAGGDGTLVGLVASATLAPTNPAEPTRTPRPTQTARPTATAGPTATPDPLEQGERLKLCTTGTDLCIVDGAGNSTALGLAKDYLDFWGFGFSPDGSQIVFAAFSREDVQQNPDYRFGHDIYIVDKGESGATPLVRNVNVADTDPSWSPDGDWIAIGGWSLSIIRPDGTGLTKLVSDAVVGNVYASAWSPDSQRLAFVSGTHSFELNWGFRNEVSIINRDGSGWRTIFSLPDPKQTSEDWITEIAWSPDGKSIAIEFDYDHAYLVDAGCEASAVSCQFSDLTPIPEIPPDWLDAFQPQWASAVLYEENFEDGKADELTSTGAYWRVVSDENGNKVYEVDTTPDVSGSTIEFGSSSWKDYAIEYRVKMLNPDSDIWVNFRNSNQGSYIQRLSLRYRTVDLYSNLAENPWQPLAEPNYNVVQGVWYLVRIEVKGDSIRVYVDGDLKIEKTDTKISAGNVAIGNLGNTHAQFDDIRVISLEEPLSNTLTPQAAQARAFAEPILQAIADRPPDFEDDFSKPQAGWTWLASNDKGEGVLRGVIPTDNFNNGVLTLTIGDDLHGNASNPDCYTFTNFVIQADMTVADVTSGGGGELGILWRIQSNSGHYHFRLWSDLTSWEVARFDSPGSATTLVSGTAKMNAKGIPNQVLIVGHGSQFAIYLNGSPLTYFEDAQLASGNSGCNFILGPGPMTIAIDNVKAWNLDNVPELPATSTLTPQAEQARAFAEPILAAIADRPPDFDDNFSSGYKGWELGKIPEWRTGTVQILDGAIKMSDVTGGVYANIFTPRDYVFKVDTRLSEGNLASTQQIGFRHAQDGKIQLIIELMSVGGTWRFSSHWLEDSNELASGTGDVSPKGEVTQIWIVARGNEYALYLNGEPVTYVQDPRYDFAGRMFLECRGDGETDCEWDNAQLWDLAKVQGIP